MAVPTHFKIVVRGVFLNTPEEWSFSLKYSRDNPAGADATYTDIVQQGVSDAIATFMGSSTFNTGTRATEWRAYQIGTDGLTEGNPLQVSLGVNGVTGTGANNKMPTDTAWCVTTEGADRGPARFGRFYLPGINVGLANDFRYSVSDTQATMQLALDFVKEVSDAIDLEGLQSSEMLNISAVGAAGARQTVRNLRLGRVPDRIERRRRQLLEDYEVTGTIDW